MALLNDAPVQKTAKSSHVRVRLKNGRRPAAMIVGGPAASQLAAKVRHVFGKSITLFNSAALESQQIDDARAKGVPIVAAVMPDANGYTGSSSIASLVKAIPEGQEQQRAEAAPDTKADYVVVVRNPEDEEDNIEMPHGHDYVIYPSAESFVDDAAGSFGVMVKRGDKVGVSTFMEALRSFAPGAESASGAMISIKTDALSVEPCEHEHDDPDTECPLCQMIADAHQDALAPAMSKTGEFTEPEPVAVLPNEHPVIAPVEEAGEVKFDDGEEGQMSIVVPRDLLIEDEE